MKQEAAGIMPSTEFERGVLLGILVGGAHFGGDGRQPQVTLKMHVRHEALLRFLAGSFPGGKLYGPYDHGGRRYFQLMYRGQGLREHLVPVLEGMDWAAIDPPSFERYEAMKARYGIATEPMFPVKLSQPEGEQLDRALAGALPPGSLFAVGGRVRDDVRGEITGSPIPAKDFDYVVTGVEAEDLRERLATLGRVDLVGASFAVFKVTLEGRTVDVALPRRERSVGTGHRAFDVESGPHVPLEDDLARRDFRMNMLARSIPDGRLVDPYGGVEDIRERRIGILSPRAFEEDPLRMLRACQFAARFAFAPSPATREAMVRSAGLIRTVSAERVTDELVKLLTLAPKPSIGLELMRETGLLAEVWPELVEGVGIEQNEWHAYDVYRHNLETTDAAPPGDVVLRLAALVHDIGKPRTKDGPHFYRHETVGADMVRGMLGRLRFPRETVEDVDGLVRNHMYVADPGLSDAAVRRFVRRVGAPNLARQFALRAADIAGSGLPKRDDSNERFEERVWAEISRKPPFSIADLRIGGGEVVETIVRLGLAEPGFSGDRRVGDALRHLLEQVTDHPERNEPSTLQALLEQYLEGCSR